MFLSSPERVVVRSPTVRLRRLFAVWIALGPAAVAHGAGDAEGVVVAPLDPASVATRAGLRAGDRLTAWEQGAPPAAEQGTLASPFDILDVEIERGPRGPVTLVGSRDGEALRVSLFPDDWGLRVRPVLDAENAALADDALRRVQAGDFDAGIGTLRTLSASASPDVRAWVAHEIAQAEIRRRRTDTAVATISEALAALGSEGHPSAAAHLSAVAGRAHHASERFAEAAAAFEQALAAWHRVDPEGLAAAAAAGPPATIAYERGKDMDAHRRRLQDAQARQEKLAPRSLALARTLVALSGMLTAEADARPALERALALARELAPDSALEAAALVQLTTVTGDPPRKEEWARRALGIYERVEPEGAGVVSSLKQLGVVLARRGELGEAEVHLTRALALQERLVRGTRQHASLLNYVANVRRDRGDLAEAERLYRGSVEIAERVQPGSVWLAISLLNLGQLLHARHQQDEAAATLQRALAIVEKEAPRSDVAGYCLTTAGAVERARGDAARAETFARRALEVFQAVNPKHPLIAEIRWEMAALLADGGRLEEAEALQRTSLKASEENAPRSPVTAVGHQRVGELALRRGDLDTAERHLGLALDLRRELAPGSRLEAESAHALGLVHRKRGQAAQAEELFQAALGAFEAQARRLGGERALQAQFRSHYQVFYRDLESLLLDQGRTAEAFHVLERSRARGLLALLSARDLRLRDVPEELERQRREADGAYDRAFRALGGSGSAPEAERATLRTRLEEARRRQEDVRARIRAAVPRAAALRDLEPVDLAGARRALAPGTLLLAYVVGPEASHLYAVGPGPDELALVRVPLGEAALRGQVTAFRETVEARRGRLHQRLVQAKSHELTEQILAPVRGQVARARQLLVVPDGVLHLVPFAALRDPARPERYLIESKPLHVTASVTLLAQLVAPRDQGPRAAEVIGFADPVYPRLADGDGARPVLTRAVQSGLRLSPLPETRRELAALRSFSPETVRVFAGAEATEERAKTVAPAARVLHFACHGFLDESFPLESGLALSIPESWKDGAENGVLQAWEVFETVRVDADLVTLSACQTGLGKEVAGEGLLGLTWAFQYAGARSVLASLWEVSDASTAELMGRFYDHLRRGRSRIEALRAAQIDVLRKPATAAPFFWSAFQINGDGR